MRTERETKLLARHRHNAVMWRRAVQAAAQAPTRASEQRALARADVHYECMIECEILAAHADDITLMSEIEDQRDTEVMYMARTTPYDYVPTNEAGIQLNWEEAPA